MDNTGVKKVELINITPERAKEMLKHNPHNRNIREGDVEKYAHDMIIDNWYDEIMQPIRISVNGNLLDGQHRLYAIIKANKTIPMWVQYGLPENSFKWMDGGTKRTLADLLKQRNKKTANNVSTLGRSTYAIEIKHQKIASSFSGRIGFTSKTNKAIYESNSILLGYIETNYDKLDECVKAGVKLRKAIGSESLKGYALAYWILDRVNRGDKLTRFVDDWASDVSRDHNVQFVKNAILKRKAIQKRLVCADIVSMVLYAYENYDTDKLLKSVKNAEKVITLYDYKLARVYEAEQC